MQKLQAFKYELQPTGEQKRSMRSFAGSCRFVYNRALALQKENHELGNKFIAYTTMANELPKWRSTPETSWLKEAPYHSLQHALKDSERAFKNFFAGRSKFPRFKRKDRSNGFRYPDPKQFELDQVNSRIRLPKLGWITYRNSREVLGALRSVTVSSNAGKWFVSIQTEREFEPPKRKAVSSVGVDVGIVQFAVLSNGTYIAPLNSFKRHQKRLAKYQLKMSHKKKFSNNWKKAKLEVQKIHTSIENARKDYLHKTTTEISKNHAIVCIEDLQVRNMSSSAAGTREKPGKRVRQKTNLNRCILDQGWGLFRQQLEYKMRWSGGILLAVPAHYTSQECPKCHYIAEDNRKTQAKFRCVGCLYENNADLVGSMNIEERGHRLLARGEPVKLNRSVKQEPTEVSQLNFS